MQTEKEKSKSGSSTKVTRTEAPGTDDPKISIPQILVEQITVEILSDSSFISDGWSAEARATLIGSAITPSTSNARGAKKGRVPQDEFEGSKYKNSKGKDCVQAKAFHSAIQAAAANEWKKNKEMTLSSKYISAAVFAVGGLIPIEFDECLIREDIKKKSSGGGSIPKWRAEYTNWRCMLTCQYNAKMISTVQVVALINTAGFGVGIGGERPQLGGANGRWHVGDNMKVRS